MSCFLLQSCGSVCVTHTHTCKQFTLEASREGLSLKGSSAEDGGSARRKSTCYRSHWSLAVFALLLYYLICSQNWCARARARECAFARLLCLRRKLQTGFLRKLGYHIETSNISTVPPFSGGS